MERPKPPPTETRKCDSCGKEAQCVLFPTARGPNTGALCLKCLSGALTGMKNDPSW
jgi:hypothetical protein